MSSYLVLARKYRPKQFSDIVGQQSVVRTLVNAIKLQRTHQAYVFSGSRGIGKTSIARIFSKALRCEKVEERNGLLYSCDECSDCKEIAAGNSVNVLEIDGASNNGVDSVREIRESAKFLPSSGKYKIYIIDEVHMLSGAAFNALLKTLEEPPEHVVFVFATTESHKIPETILGRCQRFDFKRVTIAEITECMKGILLSEKIEAEPAALNLIARAAEGSMRDALSILDQVISFSGLKVSAEAVRQSIGLIGTELVFALLKSILERDAKQALTVVQGAFNQGVDLKVLMKVLIEMLHALILMQVGIERPETHFNDDELKQLSSLIPTRALDENELIFQVFHHGLDLLSRAAQPKLIFDLLVVKTALAERLVKLDTSNSAHTSNDADEVEPARGPRQVVAPAPVASQFLQPSVSHAVVVKAVVATPEVSTPVMASQAKVVHQLKPEMVSPPVSQAPVVKPVSIHLFDQPVKKELNLESQEPQKTEKPKRTGPRTWEGFIELCFDEKPVLAVTLESVVEWKLPDAGDPAFKLGFRERDKIKAEQIMQKVFRDQLTQTAEDYFELKVMPEVYFSTHTGESVAEKTNRLQEEVKNQKMQAILNHEVVQEAKALFGAELTHVELLERDS